MKHYIDKDALAAEIEKRISNLISLSESCPANTAGRAGFYAQAQTLEGLKSFINTLEAKEVDLEKELDRIWFDNKFGDMFENSAVDFANVREICRHFFELGLQARIDKEFVEEVYSHIDSIKDTADRMTSGNFMHNRAAIKFSANTIAKVLELMGLKAQKGE